MARIRIANGVHMLECGKGLDRVFTPAAEVTVIEQSKPKDPSGSVVALCVGARAFPVPETFAEIVNALCAEDAK